MGPRALADLARGAGWLGVVGLVTAVFNLTFYVEVARTSGAASYGAIAALLPLVTVAMFLAAGTEYTVSRITVLHRSGTNELVRHSLLAVWPWLPIAALLVLLSGPIAAYLRLDSALQVALGGVLFAVVMLNAVAMGILAGRQRFAVMTFLQFGTAVARLLCGALLARGSGAVTGAMIAALAPVVACGVVAAVVAARTPGHTRTTTRVSREQLKTVAGDGVSGAFLAACLWAVWALPLVFARHDLAAVAAGGFAAAQLMAGALVWTNAVVVKAFYPLALRRSSARAVATGGAATAAVCVAGAIVLSAVGPALLTGVFGTPFSATASVFGALSLSASATAVLTYCLWMSRALRRYVFVISLCITAIVPVELIVGSVLGGSAVQLALGPAVAVLIGVAVTVVASTLTARRLPRPGGVVVESLGGAARAAIEESA